MTRDERVAEIRSLIRGWTGRRHERKILELIKFCPSEDLDTVLAQLNLRRLVRNLHNRVSGPDYRNQLLQLLTVERIESLSRSTRVNLVWALQHGSTRRSLELAIRNVILASTGEELRDLRNDLNNSRSHRDLPRLIFKDIDDAEIRAEILNHIRDHQAPTSQVKVLSDIDDTVFARLHDRRYPGKTRYPGVLAFFRELARGAEASDDEGHVTFVTARPGLFGGIVAAWTRRTLKAAGLENVSILTGSLLALRNHSSMASRKIANIRQYHQVFPEYGLVFVGDSGQGDAEVGRRMIAELPDTARAVFIHDISVAGAVTVEQNDTGIVYFDTYIAAATEAWQRGLITFEQAFTIAKTAMHDLDQLTLIPPAMKRDRISEHQLDLSTLKDTIRT